MQQSPPPLITCPELLLPIGDGELLVSALEIRAGVLYRVVGGADSGASDFMQLLAGLETTLEGSAPAEAGRVVRRIQPVDRLALHGLRWENTPLFDIPQHVRARQIGFVWEDPETAFLGAKVREEYWYQPAALAIAPYPSLWSLREFGLYEKRDQDIFTLSGGEKHRLNIATVFSIPRRLIVADFGSSNLDDDFEQELATRLKSLVSDGVTVVLRGLEYRNDLDDAQWIVVDKRVVSAPTAAKPALVTTAAEQQTILRNTLNRRAEGDTLLVIDNAQPQHAVGTLNCAVQAGQIVIVRGRNGVGKTSLGRAIASERPKLEAGTIRPGTNVRPSMALQTASHTFLARNVSTELPDNSLLELCGLKPRSGDHPLELNAEQQKVLSVAAALHHAKGIAILDEPSCGMSLPSKIVLATLLNAFPRLGIIIFTHDDALDGLGRGLEMV